MSAKSDVLKKIEAKAKKAKELREGLKSQTNRRHIFKFFEEVEFLASTSANREDFYYMLIQALSALDTQLKSMDPLISKVNVEWNDNTEHPSMRGITIQWSNGNSEYVDVTETLLS